jgi:hypothetical protein
MANQKKVTKEEIAAEVKRSLEEVAPSHNAIAEAQRLNDEDEKKRQVEAARLDIKVVSGHTTTLVQNVRDANGSLKRAKAKLDRQVAAKLAFNGTADRAVYDAARNDETEGFAS